MSNLPATKFAIKRPTESVVSFTATHIIASHMLPLMFCKVSSSRYADNVFELLTGLEYVACTTFPKRTEIRASGV
jgi:hypothetical protein